MSCDCIAWKILQSGLSRSSGPIQTTSVSGILSQMSRATATTSVGVPVGPLGRTRAATGGDERVRLRAATVSFVVSMALLAVKLTAYHLTGSAAVLADGLESIVNVVAAAFAVGSVLFAGKPADRSHPYGHGKIEFFTAAFEGGMISFAAVFIFWESVHVCMKGPEVTRIGLGIGLVVGAGVVNALLGWYLLRTGRRHNSLTLIADGRHVLSDFYTGVGVVAGLFLVRVTGLRWVDPAVAFLVGIGLVIVGFRLVRHAAGGLLDEEDPDLMVRLVGALDRARVDGVIRIHHLRAIRMGRFHHVDAHLVMPEFWEVERAHQVAEDFERAVLREFGMEGEILFHSDPCGRIYCAHCEIGACPIRRQPFDHRPALTVDEAVRPDPA